MINLYIVKKLGNFIFIERIIWRLKEDQNGEKWDLHVHTPDSIVHHYKKTDTQDVWGKYLCDLEDLDPSIKVLGINDYLFLDGYKKVVKAKTDGRLQNIELISI